jgi:hypothetical protein
VQQNLRNPDTQKPQLHPLPPEKDIFHFFLQLSANAGQISAGELQERRRKGEERRNTKIALLLKV